MVYEKEMVVMVDSASEAWIITFTVQQVDAIKVFGRRVTGAHVDSDIEPPDIAIILTLSSWSSPTAEVACGSARGHLGNVVMRTFLPRTESLPEIIDLRSAPPAAGF